VVRVNPKMTIADIKKNNSNEPFFKGDVVRAE